MNAARDRHRREAGPTRDVRSFVTMSPLIRFISWTVAIGNRGATTNAWRAIEERAQADATLDALAARMSVGRSGDTQAGATQSGEAQSREAQSGEAQSGETAPSRAA
jgi:hypothetical protein